jgi:hypothetical protein
MFKTTSMLSVLSGLLLSVACAEPKASETRNGSVMFVMGSGSTEETEDAAPGRFTIVGLDQSFRTHVELSTSDAAQSVRVNLPAGLYVVDAAASAGHEEPVIPALSSPKLVVVAAGSVTTVNVRRADSQPLALADL